MKRSPLKRKTPLRAKSQPKRGSPAKRKPPPPGFAEEVKAQVRRRSGNQCEVRAEGVCTGRAIHFHHRKLRRHGDHRACNCLHVCAPCHDHIHGSVGKSRLMGWIVLSVLDPADVPVKRGGAGR